MALVGAAAAMMDTASTMSVQSPAELGAQPDDSSNVFPASAASPDLLQKQAAVVESLFSTPSASVCTTTKKKVERKKKTIAGSSAAAERTDVQRVPATTATAGSASSSSAGPIKAPAKKRASSSHGESGKVDLATAMKAKKCRRSSTGPALAKAPADAVSAVASGVAESLGVSEAVEAASSAGTAGASAETILSPAVGSAAGTGTSCSITSSNTAQVDEATFGRKEELGANVIMCMRTLQAAQWRTLVDALKDLVPQCPVEFDGKGMRLVSMDPGHVAMIHLQALSEFYYCRAPISVGLNVVALYKMLRNLTTAGYMLEFTLTSDEPEYLMVIITNSDKKTVTRNKLKLMRLTDESYEIPQTTFHRVLSIPSSDFMRYIRELSAVSKRITIKSTKNVLELSATGSFGSTTIEIKPTPSGMHWTHIQPVTSGGDEVISGVFFSKYLERFARPLDNVVELFLKKDYPLVIRYVLASAIIRLVIGQIADDDEAGAEDDMDDAN